MTNYYVLLAVAAIADVLSTRYAVRRGATKLKSLLGFKLVAGLGIASMWYLTPPAAHWAYWLPVAVWFAFVLWNMKIAMDAK